MSINEIHQKGMRINYHFNYFAASISSQITAEELDPAEIFNTFYFLNVEIMIGCSEKERFLFPN